MKYDISGSAVRTPRLARPIYDGAKNVVIMLTSPPIRSKRVGAVKQLFILHKLGIGTIHDRAFRKWAWNVTIYNLKISSRIMN